MLVEAPQQATFYVLQTWKKKSRIWSKRFALFSSALGRFYLHEAWEELMIILALRSYKQYFCICSHKNFLNIR